jgi:hypothetical protein
VKRRGLINISAFVRLLFGFEREFPKTQIEIEELECVNGMSRIRVTAITGLDEAYHDDLRDRVPKWIAAEDVFWLEEPEFHISEENQALFKHYRSETRPMLKWYGNHRDIQFEVVRWETAPRPLEYEATSSMIERNYRYNAYLFLYPHKVPPKYGPSTFWLEPEPFLWPMMPEEGWIREGMSEAEKLKQAAIARDMNIQAKKANRRSPGRKVYRADGHPILGGIEFHGGLTYYEREYDDDKPVIKVGCDYAHSCDTEWKDPSLMIGNWHPLPITLNLVLDHTKEAIDSFYKLVPEYGGQKE